MWLLYYATYNIFRYPTQEVGGGNDEDPKRVMGEDAQVKPSKVKQMGRLGDKMNADLDEIDKMKSVHEMEKPGKDGVKKVAVLEEQCRLYLIGQDQSKKDVKFKVQ